MSLIDVARDTLKEIPMADILRERLSLALDQSAGFERQISALQTELGKLQAQIEIVTLDRDKAREELQRLKDEHVEEIRIHSGIEFRRGKRTGGHWMPFCAKCHVPALDDDEGQFSIMCSAQCGWTSSVFHRQLSMIVSQLPP
jgi:hypothetical protein